jgi:hypothetical protein
MIEKETAREANSVDIPSTRKHGTPGKVAFTSGIPSFLSIGGLHSDA